MKIAFVLAGLGAGGAERVVALLSGHWAAGGHDVTVIAFDRETDAVFHAFDPRVRLVRLGLPPTGQRGGGSVLRTMRRIVRLRRVLRALRPATVVAFLLKINVVTLLATRGLPVRVIVSERNHPLRGGSRLWRWARDRLYPRAATVVLQTHASQAVLPRRIVARCVVIPNPVTVFARTPEPAAHRVLAAVGRLEPQKGFDLLLTAFAQVAPRHLDWRLTIWGEGPCRAQLERQRDALGLSQRVSLPGTSPAPGGWIATASAFVLSSRFEGFGNAIAEAMAAGLPIAAFGCEFGVDEMLQGGRDGLMVAPEDVDALAAAIDRLLGDEILRRELGARASLSAKRFRTESVFAAWDALLESTGT